MHLFRKGRPCIACEKSFCFRLCFVKCEDSFEKDTTMRKTVMTLTCLILVSAFLSACSNTFEGAGRDVENAGEWVQDTF